MAKEILNKTQPSNTSESSCSSSSRPSNEYVLNVAFLSFLLFTLLQFVFAWAAGSQAMMADCAAMSVDVLTYLFNFFAERIKHSKLSPEEQAMPVADGIRHRELRRLYLELFPPLLSVITLSVVTIVATYQAVVKILADDKNLGDQPNVLIMLALSGLNLILDMVNVTCFARAGQAEYLPSSLVSSMESSHHHQHCNHSREDSYGTPTEASRLVGKGTTNHGSSDHDEESPHHEINLNMCSAWTHICADTLRSVAVLVAAGIATLFPADLSPIDADSAGSIVVSLIIFASLLPLIQGLWTTAHEIRDLGRQK